MTTPARDRNRHAVVRLLRHRFEYSWVIDHCPFCGKRHTHGGGAKKENPRDFLGWRVPHCDANVAAQYRLVEAKP